LSRLFISHSSKDSVAAVAFKQWLGANGWPAEDVFLDLEDIGGGERWKDALRKAHSRCEAVILLASPDALSSPECLTEVRKAEDFGKEIIVVLLRELSVEDRRLDSYKERQIVDLSAQPQAHRETVDFRGSRHEVSFNDEALLKIKDYLIKRGITPESFPWPPADRPDAAPFPGLSAFTQDDAAIFFGRDADIVKGLDEFRLLRRNGSPRFLAIQAASGAGKSSYLRAGLWPRLGRDPDFAPLAILRAAQGILTGPEGLGRNLARELSRPGAPINPGDVHRRLMGNDTAKASDEFATLIATAAAQAHAQRRVAVPDAPPPALIIAVDQAEELLAPEYAEESQRFLFLLAELMHEPPPGVELFGLLTVRADNVTRLFEALAERGLEVPKALTLLPLPRTSYRDVIVKPTEILARRGERVTISAELVERLVADAAGADALPLLAFTLSYLYKEFSAGGSLTLEHYESLGGIAGSIDKALKQALARPGDAPAIPAAAEEQLACLRATFIPWLARIDQSGEATRRVARLDEFVGASRAMVERLTEKRLLVADRRGGADVVEVAHESLLRQWPPLTTWLQAAADDLRVIDAVERAADEWVRNARAPAWLDHRADRLAAAERVAANEDLRRRLGAARIEYLKACRARETRRRRIARAAIGAVAAVGVIAAVLGFQAWQQHQQAMRAQKEAEVSLLIAQSQTNRATYGNIPRALQQADRAYQLIPSTASRSALLQALVEISPHVKGVVAFDDGAGQALAWTSENDLEVATASWQLQSVDANKPTARAGGWSLPSIKRPQDGNRSFVRALAPLDADRTIVVFDEGSIGLYRRGTRAMEVQTPMQPVSANPIQHAVAVGSSGATIGLATAEGTIALYRCDWNKPGRSTSRCAPVPFGDVHGRVVAISPDETRVAVGEGNTVTVYNLAGKPIGGGPRTFASAVVALGWAEQRDWLAVGTEAGDVAVFDPATQPEAFVTQQTFGNRPISALAWNPRELGLAFVCSSTAICLLQPNIGKNTEEPFKTAIRFEGHGNAVTRLAFAPNGAYLASLAADGTMRIWSLTQDADVTFALYADNAAEFATLAVSPDRRWVAAGGNDGTVDLWDAQSGAAGPVFKPSESSAVQHLAWNRKGAVASLQANQTISVVSTDPRQPPINIPVPTGSHYLTWTGDDSLIALPGDDGGVLLVDPAAADKAPVRIGSVGGEAWGIAAVPGTRLLLVSYVGGEIKILDLTSKQFIGSMRNPAEKLGVGSLSVNSDARLLATSSGNGVVPLYDIGKRAIARLQKTESSQISAAAFSPNGQKLAALGNDNWLYVWTLEGDEAELYLALPVITRRSLVGNTGNGREVASWLDWVSDDRAAIAMDSAAIRVITIDPAKWRKRMDGLALGAKPGIE
jgi:WD40 repeat protein